MPHNLPPKSLILRCPAQDHPHQNPSLHSLSLLTFHPNPSLHSPTFLSTKTTHCIVYHYFLPKPFFVYCPLKLLTFCLDFTLRSVHHNPIQPLNTYFPLKLLSFRQNLSLCGVHHSSTQSLIPYFPPKTLIACCSLQSTISSGSSLHGAGM